MERDYGVCGHATRGGANRGAVRRVGLTLVEGILILTVVGVLAGAGVVASRGGYEAVRASRTAAELESRAERAIDRVARELVRTAPDVLFPRPTGSFGVSDLVFQQAGESEARGLRGAWGAPVRIAFEYEEGELDDGQDNDGDGLVDEGVLVLVRDDGSPEAQRVVLCRGVRELLEGELENGVDDNGNGLIDERGFDVHQEGGLLVVRLTLEGAALGTNGAIRSSVHTSTVSVRMQDRAASRGGFHPSADG